MKAKRRITRHIHPLSPFSVTIWLQNNGFSYAGLTQVKKTRMEAHFSPKLFLCYKTCPYICIGKKKKLWLLNVFNRY